MKKRLAYIAICMFFIFHAASAAFAQTDSLIKLISVGKEDTNKVNQLIALSKMYFSISPDSANMYLIQAKNLADKIGFKKGYGYAIKFMGNVDYMQGKYVDAVQHWESSLAVFDSLGDKKGSANILSNLGALYENEGGSDKALELYLKAFDLAEEINDSLRMATVLINIGALYYNSPGKKDKALEYDLKALKLSEAINDLDAIGTTTANLGEIYMDMNQDSLALFYFNKSLKAFEGSENLPYTLNEVGKFYLKKGDYASAIKTHQQAFDIAKNLEATYDMTQSLMGLGMVYQKKGDLSSAIQKYSEAQTYGVPIRANLELVQIYTGLTESYQGKGDLSNALKYQTLLLAIKDTIYNTENDKKLGTLQFNFDLAKKQGQIDLLTKDSEIADKDLQKQKFLRNSFIVGFILLIIVALLILNRYQIKQRALNQLKAAQQQLIRQEKLASLGSLTAGIAHEIKNPLNFVNNFSSLSGELLSELIASNDMEEKNEIGVMLKQNIEKISHHGKRADGIVASMLELSGAGTGTRQETDINKLCEDLANRSYNSIKVKNPAFECEIVTQFDLKNPKANVIAADISRVLQNVFSNAFYAVQQNEKPKIAVLTKQTGNKIELIVTDNGNGIPEKNKEKIFEPFFTTKPTTEGFTGLGLSISYDIVQAHGGEITMQSGEGQGTSFTIVLPG